jgi:hypothetical protein
MLISFAPVALRDIVKSLDTAPTSHFSVMRLDEIADGKLDESIEHDFTFGFYKGSMLSNLDWWVEVMKTLAWGGYDEEDADFNEPFEQKKENLIELLNDALSSFTASLAEDFRFTTADNRRSSPATVEFLKRYRLYTRAVCAVAQESWPNADLGRLLMQP